MAKFYIKSNYIGEVENGLEDWTMANLKMQIWNEKTDDDFFMVEYKFYDCGDLYAIYLSQETGECFVLDSLALSKNGFYNSAQIDIMPILLSHEEFKNYSALRKLFIKNNDFSRIQYKNHN